MYKSVYDERHSFTEFDACKENFNKTRRKGIYEKLLCRECEDKIKYLEDYGKEILYEKVNKSICKPGDKLTINDYDYTRFKNFILSIIWRASVSTQGLFKLVSLGKYEEELRNVLLENSETTVDNFPCLIYKLFIDQVPANGVFLEAFSRKSKVNSKTIYQLVADGYFLFIGIGKQSIKTFKYGSSVSPENLRISSDKIHKIDEFIDVYARLEEQDKFRVFKNKTAARA